MPRNLIPKYEVSTIFLSASEVARLTGVTPHTIWVWRKQGKGPPYVMIGARARYPRALFDAWMESQAAQQTDKAE